MGITYKGKKYSYEDSGELCRRIQKDRDSEAMDIMVRLHDGLVKKILKRLSSGRHGVVDEDDLFQAGRIGLLEAAEKYDPEIGAFSTYASWWILQKMQKEIEDRGHTIRIPAGSYKEVLRLERLRNEKLAGLSHKDFVKAASKELGISEEKVETLLAAYKTQSSIASLNAFVRTDDGMDLAIEDVIPDKTADFAEESARTIAVQRWLVKGFDVLSDRERLVLTCRYGLDGKGVRTYDVISHALGVSRQAVNQQEIRAIKKLRTRAEKDNMMPVLSYYAS